jgi:hypothetical protein
MKPLEHDYLVYLKAAATRISKDSVLFVSRRRNTDIWKRVRTVRIELSSRETLLG